MRTTLQTVAFTTLLALVQSPQRAPARANGAPQDSAGLVAAPAPCTESIADQAQPGVCLRATSTPTPGMLFPPPHDGGVQNVQSGQHSFVGGGFNNTASGADATIGGGSFNDATDTLATVGGGFGNQALGEFSTVSGGSGNYASALYCSVGGGVANFANGERTTIGGGVGNTAQGGDSTIAGGASNSTNFGAFVGGGAGNVANGLYSCILGGGTNETGGAMSTVCGGQDNSALGSFSLAAGHDAHADHFGSFVWASEGGASSADHQFSVFASGGTRIFSDGAGSAGVVLAPGAGSWSTVSDRNHKENIAPVDPDQVLDRVAALSLSTWNYTTQDASIRHLGPMAQEFHAAFGLGTSPELIDTVDADGVALAAIQGLYARLAARDQELDQLRSEVLTLRQRVEELSSDRAGSSHEDGGPAPARAR